MSKWWKRPDGVVLGPKGAALTVETILLDSGISGGRICFTIHAAGSRQQGSILNCWLERGRGWERVLSGKAYQHPPDPHDFVRHMAEYLATIRRRQLVQDDRLSMASVALSTATASLIG